jgi:hypothetical protein
MHLRLCDVDHMGERLKDSPASVLLCGTTKRHRNTARFGVSVIDIAARSYAAARLAMAIVEVSVASPALAPKQVQLPSVSSVWAELSAFVSDVEREARHAVSDAAVGAQAVRNAVNRATAPALQGTATAAQCRWSLALKGFEPPHAEVA